jgi:hypothetical protein
VAPVVLEHAPATSSAVVIAGDHEETTATAVVALYSALYSGPADSLVEEPMDYTPITPGGLAGPVMADEEWPAGTGPMGF